MEVKEFRCKVISPLLMAGADGNSPERRTTEIKGMMRFWWRAAMAEENINLLRNKESEIFGGTIRHGREEKHIKSPFSIRISNANLKTGKFKPLPHRKDVRFEFRGFDKGSFFTVTMKGRQIDVAESAFYIAVFLGGFGKRSRRGFGSLFIEGVKLNLEKIKDHLNKISGGRFELVGNGEEIKIKEGKGGNYPWIKSIRRGKRSYADVNVILRRIGEASHEFNEPSLGTVGGKVRFASPVYVSIYKENEKFYPVVTVLNTAPPQELEKEVKNTLDKQEEFVDYILRWKQ